MCELNDFELFEGEKVARSRLKRVFATLYFSMSMVGVDPVKALQFFAYMPGYLVDLLRFVKASRSDGERFGKVRLFPCLRDKRESSGHVRSHYFHQDLLVARRIFECRPERHVDVGSRIDGFVAHVASYRQLEVFDIRPLNLSIKNVRFVQADFSRELDESMRECCDSLSCLHTIEHFGLGRYGDPIDPRGYVEGFRNICSVLKKGGKLYLSVPIGPQRIEFNAHRVFSVMAVKDLVAEGFSIERFSFVDDQGCFFEDVVLDEASVGSNFGCYYGCGIFELIKR